MLMQATVTHTPKILCGFLLSGIFLLALLVFSIGLPDASFPVPVPSVPRNVMASCVAEALPALIDAEAESPPSNPVPHSFCPFEGTLNEAIPPSLLQSSPHEPSCGMRFVHDLPGGVMPIRAGPGIAG